MLKDRYDNEISTSSTAARDAYVAGVDLFLGANAGAIAQFEAAVAVDPEFALAHAALARAHQMVANSTEAAASIAAARAAASGLTARESEHLAIYELLLKCQGPVARAAIVRHVASHPRDAMVVQPATGVFGLIGFSGCDGREAVQLEFMQGLQPHYPDDWWFLGQLAFAQSEMGEIVRAEATIERALSGNPRNANAAHIKAHIHYEQGEASAGLAYLDAWSRDYDPASPLYCHVNWHRAIWALEQGHADRAWDLVEAHVLPGQSDGSPPLNQMTDSAAFLFRAELAGERRRPDLWQKLADFVTATFPKSGIAFADFHAALVYAMAGDPVGLARIKAETTGKAGPVVQSCAAAFEAFAGGDFEAVVRALEPVLSRHETLGGSRAQRDLLEYTYTSALLRLGRMDEACRALARRRPGLVHDDQDLLAGRIAPDARTQKHASRANHLI